MAVGETQSPENRNLAQKWGNRGITLELSLTGISHVIEIMTILDKAGSLCKSEEAQQSIAAK